MSFGEQDIRQVLVDPTQFAADWQLQSSVVGVGNGAVRILLANPRRIAVLLSAIISTTHVTIGTDSSISDGKGYILGAAPYSSNVIFTLSAHGGLVQSELWGFVAPMSSASVGIIEVIWQPIR